MYLLDANILIRAHGDYYALDRVPPFWEWLQHHGQAGAVKIPSEIYEEMAGGGAPRPGDLLVPHLRQAALKRALILREETDINVVQAVLAAAYGTATPTELELEEMGQAPLLVAYAVADAPNRDGGHLRDEQAHAAGCSGQGARRLRRCGRPLHHALRVLPRAGFRAGLAQPSGPARIRKSVLGGEVAQPLSSCSRPNSLISPVSSCPE